MKDHRKIDMSKVDSYFLEVDLNVTVESKFSKETPAHLCCKNGHMDLLKRILVRSPDACSKLDDQGNTLLHSLMNVSHSRRYITFPLISELCEQA